MAIENHVRLSEWIKQLPPSILQSDEIPLFGKSPAFPWEQLSGELARTLQITNFQIKPTEQQWRTQDKLLSGLTDPLLTSIAFSPLEGSLIWAMPKKDAEELMRILLTKHPDEFTVVDPDFQQGFYKFITAQVIQTIAKLDFDKNLSPTIHTSEELPDQPAFCIDVSVDIGPKTLHGRAIIPNELRQSWKERYAERKLGFDLDNPLSQKLQTIVHLEAGRTEMSRVELADIKPGDFILLDLCSFDPHSDKGRVLLTANDVPLFRARLKQGSLKILEFPFYHEVETSMKNHNEDDEEFEDHESEFEDHESEFEDEPTEGHEEVTETDELEEQEGAEEEAHEEEESEVKLQKEPPPAAAQKSKKVNPSELPVTVVVEVGRLQISIQKLMELQPGNTLDLDIHPENGVDLVVNGRRIGKGELLKAGDTLGVRVLDIG